MKEQIEKRIKELQEAKDQFLANANACQGGINELQTLLNKYIEVGNAISEVSEDKLSKLK